MRTLSRRFLSFEKNARKLPKVLAVLELSKYYSFIDNELEKPEMKTAADYRIESVQRVTLNGSPKKLFRAFVKLNNGTFVFAGNFSAPASTPNADLWKFAK